MNFGGPPYGHGVPPYTNAPPYGYATAVPGMFPPMTAVPGMPVGQPLPTSYPQGQGPLAGIQARRGENGLFEAPEPEGPEAHEAKQYMKLNPGEEVKYGEYWAQAAGENESVGGKDAVSFLGRAAKVSKGQLRRIWDIADHQKEGFLGRDEFYIALRLVALAQRGAELSVTGLRNFSGINLIPNIAPAVKEEADTPASTSVNRNEFSWTVPPTVVAKYDSFFKSLDTNNTGMIDGKQGVTFFGKSGLPRPTLKKIWELADVTRDGMLSLDEFRSAMHMVSSIRNKRLTATALPSTLDPNGPNWLRIVGQEVPATPSEINPSAHIEQGPMQPPDQARVLAPAPPAPGLDKPPPPPQEVGNSGSPRGYPQMAGHAPARPETGYPEPQIPLPVPSPELHAVPTLSGQNQQVPNHLPSRSDHLAQSREAEQMREALRRERLEIEQARREMEEMRAEMERLRLEKASLAVAPSSPSRKAQLDRNSDPYGQHRSPRVSPAMAGIPGPPSAISRPRSNSVSPRVVSKPGPVTSPKHAATATTQPSTVIPPTRTEPISLGNDDEDDIWDQPSPKASALPSPFPDTSKTNTTARPEGSVSSDDDDDFWEGLGAKPTLGSSGVQKPGESKSKGFGGSELDDWAF